uniref:MULE transposase domain-containing protein n=1 Tax=Lactuca sativa TaxID=4236 RepID=A0A9R1UL20_LACSA|nr:hypothetical protein LSAT_V11C800443870 [Lactuca sativa]
MGGQISNMNHCSVLLLLTVERKHVKQLLISLAMPLILSSPSNVLSVVTDSTNNCKVAGKEVEKQHANVKKTNTLLIRVCSSLVHLLYCRGLQRWSAYYISFCFKNSNDTLISLLKNIYEMINHQSCINNREDKFHAYNITSNKHLRNVSSIQGCPQIYRILLFHNNPIIDLPSPNDVDDINDMNKDETASIDDEFVSRDDEKFSTDDMIIPQSKMLTVWITTMKGSSHLPKIFLKECKSLRTSDCIDQHLVIAGKSYWIVTIPSELKPIKELKYPSDHAIEDMYRKYAYARAFDVRNTTNKKKCGIVYMKYLVCNRQGLLNTSPVDTLSPTRSKIKRTNTRRTHCNVQLLNGGCMNLKKNTIIHLYQEIIWCFHVIIGSQMTLKSFILTMSNQNIGSIQILGGYNFVGGLIDDFKNYMRGLNCFTVDKLDNRKENVKNFSFEYRVENKQLNALFWAAETSKINYKEFGDVVSFDATFRTNEYHMVFVPCIGIDNHKRCVTDSFIWLLKSFFKAFGKQPLLVLSDQDQTMKKVVETVFPQSIHRLCT